MLLGDSNKPLFIRLVVITALRNEACFYGEPGPSGTCEVGGSTETVCGRDNGRFRTKDKTLGFVQGHSANTNLFLLVLEREVCLSPGREEVSLLLVQLGTIAQH